MQWLPYLIAVVIGLLVGIEREKSNPDEKVLGVRTFLLISLLGVLAGDVPYSWLAALLTTFALSLIAISYFTQTNREAAGVDRGLTTEFAAGVVFGLSFVAHQSPALSAMLGPLVAMILFSKRELHRFTQAIKPFELQAALLIILTGVVIIDFVPDRVVDPWGILNPRKFGYIILTLAVLEFLSYVLAKLIGEKKGSILIGFLGGLVSSTSVLLSSARQAQKSPANSRALVGSALAAKLSALIELFFIVGLISPTVLIAVAAPLGLVFLWGAFALIWIARKKGGQGSDLNLRSPLDWKGVLRLSVLLGAILVLISLTEILFGDQGTFVLSFLTGLFELHGVSVATATMHIQNQLSLVIAAKSILLAVIASLVSKIFISWAISRNAFARALTFVFLPMIAILATVLWF